MTVTVDPVLEFAYQQPQPNVYLVHAPKFTAKLDMFHGLVRYLADDDDVVRLDGRPLFTFSDGQKDLLFAGTEKAFTWPVEVPASLTAHAYDRARYQVIFFGDRFMVRMDRNWTQFEKAYFTVPGEWVSPNGAPQWKRIVATDGAGRDVVPPQGKPMKVAAAELAFPGAKWNLCFDFKPAQEVTFEGTGMKFQLGTLTGDTWTVGFCKPGELSTWRW
jgi:hypothetical protein